MNNIIAAVQQVLQGSQIESVVDTLVEVKLAKGQITPLGPLRTILNKRREMVAASPAAKAAVQAGWRRNAAKIKVKASRSAWKKTQYTAGGRWD